MSLDIVERLTAQITGVEHSSDAQEQWMSVAELLHADADISKSEITQETGLHPREFLKEIVAHHGGRMWQGQLVDTLGWSESGVSRFLSELEAGGAIERTLIGRKKIVFLPGHGPEASKSTTALVGGERRAEGPESDA